MATVKKTSKKKIIVPIAIVLVIAIIVTSVVVVKAKTSSTEVSLNTISTDDIEESVSATGEVSAGATKEYKASTVATVKEVFVSVGDEVKEGDKIATFDTSTVDSQISKLQNQYNESKEAYNSALKTENEAKEKLSSVNSQISKLEKKVSSYSSTSKTTTATTTKRTTTTAKKTTKKSTTKKATTKKATTKKATTTTKKATTVTTASTTTTTTTSSNSSSTSRSKWSDLSDLTSVTVTTNAITTSDNWSDVQSSLTELTSSMKEISESLVQLTDDVTTMNQLMTVISDTVVAMISSGEISPDAIAEACGSAVSDAIQQGIIDETKLIVDSGVAVDMVEKAVKSIDWDAVAESFESTDTAQETATKLQLAALYAEKEIFSASANSGISDAQKTVMDTAKEALDALQESQEDLQAGWTAAFDGTITACDLKAGEQTSLISDGVKLENTDAMVVTISLGEYDVHKVKTGMQATITTAYGTYNGEIATIAPTASGGSSSSIVDSVGSMAGISGLSSLTDSGAGVECTVTVDEPDSNIIIGFDADVTIITGQYYNVTCVPIESIVLEKDGKYVYLYDEAESTVTKTAITTGASSDTSYQVTSGLNIGDKIVSTPSSDYEEESFKVRVVDKTTASSTTTTTSN